MAAPQAQMSPSIADPSLHFAVDAGRAVAAPAGDWTIRRASVLEDLVGGHVDDSRERKARLAAEPFSQLTVDLGDLDRLDTTGALVLNRLMLKGGVSVRVVNAREPHLVLLQEVVARDKPAETAVKRCNPIIAGIEHMGLLGLTLVDETRRVLGLLGGATVSLGRWLVAVKRFRFASYVTHLERTGLNATPIIALMSFLIGAILAQQGSFYFRRFGADLYVVGMAGMLTLRELGVLLTAIMVAGRSGSAFTAELGSMKMREEVDALRVLGLDPVEVLILPRLLALITALPILTFISDLAALFGAALASVTYAGIPVDVFLSRLQAAVDMETFFVGFSKAPFMALIIGLIASLEGLQVEGSAESLGTRTTQAVVKSIFFVIVVDGVFAIFFGAIGV